MIKWITALACAAVIGGCASQGEPVSTASQPAVNKESAEVVAEADSGSRMVCKRHKPIGSNRIQKVCRTRDQWDAETTRTQSGLARRQGQGGGCLNCGGDGAGGGGG